MSYDEDSYSPQLTLRLPGLEHRLEHLEIQLRRIMASIDDLRNAQGAEAQAIASLGVLVGDAAQRVSDKLTALVGNQVTDADVASVQADVNSLKTVSDQVAAIGADPSTAVPPANEAQPLDTAPAPEQPTNP